ncbi:DUF1671-domain-containing protein [Tothia fuscella]|uniref:DUF1671-domain-containing protein n=1 Tax=Tothia fuscella TaxID=1048955 RepID=A0A9P4NIK5_9PEZI|nr:DUF1671-domain-containing protein [Tothia fuscella]
MTGHLECYFQCGVLCSSLEDLAFHIELVHRETSDISPFVVRKSKEQSPPAFPGRAPPPIPLSSKEKVRVQQVTATKDGKAGSGDDDELDLSIICDGCGEHLVLLSDLDEHHEMHEAERLILNDGPSSSSQSNVINSAQEHSSSPSSFIPSNSRTITGANSPSFSTDLSPALRHEEHRTMHQQQSQRQSLGRKFLSMVGMERKSPGKPRRDTERLGKKELGPHAYEDRMPESLIKHLQKGPKVTRSKVISRSGGVVTREEVQGETIGVLPVLRRLIEYDPYVRIAYLCHPTVKQIGKDKYEGGFCGYRSIQMQVSYLQGCKAPGCEHFPGRTPSIFELQDQIETAWDNKIHWHSRSQIGVLKYTRKWIGTLEAHAIYQNLGIPCQVQQFSDTERQYAHEQLLDYVEEYFANVALMDGRKVQLSLKPPIYFQRPGHSMVIVGLEKMQNGVRNLLVFDPMYQAPKAMEQLVQRGERKIRAPDPKLLHFYRRSEYRLENYVDFECLELTGDNLPIFPAWDVRSE